MVAAQAVAATSTTTPALRVCRQPREAAEHLGPPRDFDFTHIPISASRIQRKPTVNAPGDAFEREADAVADQVLGMPEHASLPAAPPMIQRKCRCCDEDGEKVQAMRAACPRPGARLDGELAVRAAERGGAHLSQEMRAYFEPQFGRDFSQVRVHSDAAAAQAVHARAYTYGRDIVFGAGEYAPSSGAGRKLLAHELTHVVQQGAAPALGAASSGRVHGRCAPAIQREESAEPPLESLLACLVWAPPPVKSLCLIKLANRQRSRPPPAGTPSPAPAPGVTPPQPQPPPQPPPSPTPLPFFHGSTWAIAQRIPGNVKATGGGDFGQGFYTHHDRDPNTAAERARWESCRLCQKMSPKERYAGVIRFAVPAAEYTKLFNNRKTFGLTSTKHSDYAARQKDWLDFVSGKGRGRQANPTYDTAHMSWRHQRVDPPPSQGFDLIEGPMYKGVEGLPGSIVPPRAAFDPYAEGTALPQQVVWNGERALAVLNAAPTTLKQFDAKDECKPVDPPVPAAPGAAAAEDPRAREEAQIGMTERRLA